MPKILTPPGLEPPDWSFVTDPSSYDHWWTFAKRALDNISRMDPIGIGPSELTAPVAMATDASLAAARLGRALTRAPRGIEAGLKTAPGGYALRAPVVAKLEDALEVARRRPAEWDLTRRFMPAVGGNLDELEKVARVYGATSPGTQFVQSGQESAAILGRGIDDLTPEAMREMGIGMVGSKLPNVRRAYAGQPLLTGGHEMKPEALAQQMLGRDRLALDRYWLSLLGLDPALTLEKQIPQVRAYMVGQEGRRLSDAELYRRLEDATLGSLRRIVGTRYQPGQTPADVWEGLRGAKGEPYYGGIGDIFERAGLMRPGAMLDPAKWRQVAQEGLFRKAAKPR